MKGSIMAGTMFITQLSSLFLSVVSSAFSSLITHEVTFSDGLLSRGSRLN
jgi:hypothetical protein